MRRLLVIAVVVGSGLMSLAGPVRAHDAPEVEIQHLTEHLQQHPDDVEAYLERARLHRVLENHSEALRDLRAAAERTDDPEVRGRIAELRGHVHIALGNDAEAVDQLTKAIERGGGTLTRHMLRGQVHERNDRLEQASEDYRAALEYGDNVGVYRGLARVESSRDRLDAAADALRRGLESTGSVVLRIELIDIERQRGEYGPALKLVEEGREEADIETRWYLRRAEILEGAGRGDRARHARQKALEEAERLIEIRPSAAAFADRGAVHLAIGRVEAAVSDLEKAVSRAPHMDRARNLLDRARRKLEGED